MTKQTMLMGAVIGLLLINLSLVAFLALRGPMSPPRERPGGNGPKSLIIEKLGFSPDQTARYERLIEQHQTEINRLKDDIRETKNRLYTTLATNDSTPKDSLINQLGVLQQQVETVHYNHFMALKQLCTLGQQDKFNELTSELADYFTPRGKPPGRP